MENWKMYIKDVVAETLHPIRLGYGIGRGNGYGNDWGEGSSIGDYNGSGDGMEGYGLNGNFGNGGSETSWYIGKNP